MRKTLLILSALIFLLSRQEKALADWVDDYFASAVTTQPASFQSQQRGYYTGGGFTARIPHKAEPLMNISAPTISAGCGGIDMFWGGVSFLNAEYLVKKGEGILKNAPFVLLQLAIKTLSTQFGDTIESVMALIDQLNNMQIDECAAAKGLVNMAVTGEAPAIMGEFDRLKTVGANMVSGVSKTFNKAEVKVANDPVGERNNITNTKNVDPKIKALTTGKGYLLDVIVQEGDLSANIADAIRAIAGDVAFDNTKANQIATHKKGCASSYNLQRYISDKTPLQKTSTLGDSVCKVTSSNSINDRAKTTLDNIFKGFTDYSFVLSNEDRTFVSMSDIPIYRIMFSARLESKDELDSSRYLLSNIAAASFAYGSLETALNVVRQVIYDYEQTIKKEETSTDTILQAIKEYKVALEASIIKFQDDYKIKLQAFYSAYDFAIKQKNNKKYNNLVPINK